jgi:hypothetical protein
MSPACQFGTDSGLGHRRMLVPPDPAPVEFTAAFRRISHAPEGGLKVPCPKPDPYGWHVQHG